MSGPRPTHNAPIGFRKNQFKLDIGTLALSQMQPPGLQIDPWSHLTLDGYAAFLKSQNQAFAAAHRFALFGTPKKMLDRYAAQFVGTFGGKLKFAVIEAAKECRIEPEIVAAILVFEQESARWWTDNNFLMRDGQESVYQAGADNFLTDRENINRCVPAARKIKILKKRTFQDDERNKIKSTEGFVAIDQLVLVTAAMVKYKEIIVRHLFKRQGHDFNSLLMYQKYYFTRLSYNPGGRLLKTIRAFLSGKDIYERTGSRSRKRPLRGATVCTALALHLKETVFS